MSPEKPNAGKPVQLFEGFLIKQYQSTIWVPKLAYPKKNFPSSYTSQFERNLLAETPENPSGSSSAQNCSATPASTQSGLRQPLLAQCWPCISLPWHCVSYAGPSGAFHNSCLPLCGPAWAHAASASLSLAAALRSRHTLCLLYTQCPSAALPITNSTSLSKPRSRE